MSAHAAVCVDEESASTNEKQNPSRKLWNCYSTADQGDEIENDLVKEYLPLVKAVVARIAVSLPSHIARDDLYSPGMVGLLKAIRNYDPSSNNSFESYARHRIRGSILDELRRMDWVPRSVHEKARRVQAAVQALEQELGRVPTEKEVAKKLEMTVDEYLRLLDKIRPVTFVSVEAAGRVDSEVDMEPPSIQDETAEDPVEETSKRELVALIAERIDELPDMARKVLAFYYYENMRLREIAEIFGVTESRICQIHTQSILTIRSQFRTQEALERY